MANLTDQYYTGIRYFEITEMVKSLPLVIVEYTGDFGAWISKSRPYRVELKQGKQLWIFSSSIYIARGTAEKSCLMLENDAVKITSVNLSLVSNPISKRQPAMGKKGQK